MDDDTSLLLLLLQLLLYEPPVFTDPEVDAAALHSAALFDAGDTWITAAILGRDLADKLHAERLKRPAPG